MTDMPAFGSRSAFRADEADFTPGTWAAEPPSTYHGSGNFDAPSGLVIGERARALLNAYLLWFFLGWVGAHRIFLKSPLSATIQAVLLLLGTTLVLQHTNRAAGLWLIAAHCLWRLADLFLIPELVRASAEIEG
ncbi:MAG: TM2 domain-containing protein [Sphingomonadales bacterium]|nr:TM2 domain-containing protein [Sphingomonadales bacterium]